MLVTNMQEGVFIVCILSLLSTHSGWMTVGLLVPGGDEGSKGGWTRLICQRKHWYRLFQTELIH